MRRTKSKRYVIDFALIIITGNLTRYLTWRPMIDVDPRVRARWYPIRTWVMDDWLGRIPALPGQLRVYVRHFLDTWRFLLFPPADAAVIHAFETYPFYVLLCRLRFWRRMPVIVWAGDDGVQEATGRVGWLYPQAVEHTTWFAPWSRFAADRIRTRYPHVPDERIVPLHPGINLAQWTLRSPRESGDRFRLLFVGGDPRRKGLETLLDAMDAELAEHCDLDVVTQALHLPDAMRAHAERLAPYVRLNLDLTPNAPELQRLYANADAFVLPTSFDCSSLASLEAMATGIPVIASNVGGIPDIVIDGETGLLVPPRDVLALVDAVQLLRTDAAMRQRLVRQARAHVEAHFDAARNTARFITAIIALIEGDSVSDAVSTCNMTASEKVEIGV